MIINEREQSYMMVTQHDHAKVSGEIAKNWREDYFLGIERKREVVLGICEHDRGWINLDKAPLWNEEEKKPYSFIDYPITTKVPYYKKGIEEVVSMNKYAGLLCSLHYTTFLQDANDVTSKTFWNKEMTRQKQLRKGLDIESREDKKKLEFHLEMLRFCDNLSLYICLNEPGIDKRNEHPFYRNGFPQEFGFANHKRILAQWTDTENVLLSTSPVTKDLKVSFTFKSVKKQDISEKGLSKAYKDSHLSIRKVKFN